MFKQISPSLLNNNVRDITDIYYLDIYHPYYTGAERHKNQNFDNFSSLILGVKNKKQFAINHFYNELDSFLRRKSFPIAIVPSSNPENIDTGISQIAVLLSQHNRIDATSCLKRHTKVEKKSKGGSRSIDIDLATIRVNNEEIIKGKVVLLLDDVTTSGNSLYASEKLLLQAGAIKVVKLALGKTASYNHYAAVR
jgi:predicted amidophosphoribosyltransferase